MTDEQRAIPIAERKRCASLLTLESIENWLATLDDDAEVGKCEYAGQCVIANALAHYGITADVWPGERVDASVTKPSFSMGWEVALPKPLNDLAMAFDNLGDSGHIVSKTELMPVLACIKQKYGTP